VVESLRKHIPWPWIAEGVLAVLFALIGFLGHDMYSRTWGIEQSISALKSDVRAQGASQISIESQLNLVWMEIRGLRQDLKDHDNAISRWKR